MKNDPKNVEKSKISKEGSLSMMYSTLLIAQKTADRYVYCQDVCTPLLAFAKDKFSKYNCIIYMYVSDIDGLAVAL
jgi:hypothetical protein